MKHKSDILSMIDIEVFFLMNKKAKLPPLGIELTTLTFTGLEVRCLFHSANQTCIEYHDLQLTLTTTSFFELGSFLDSTEGA